MITSQPDRGAAWGVQDCFCCWLRRLHPGNNFCLQQVKLGMILSPKYPFIGGGGRCHYVAVVDWDHRNTHGLLWEQTGTVAMGLSSCLLAVRAELCHIFDKFSFFRLDAVSSLTDCWYWLLLLLRWHSWRINLRFYLFRSKATLNLQLFLDCGSSAGALCLPRGCRDRGTWKTNCQNDICVFFHSFR